MVGFDTTILPGREGTITEEVSLGKVHDGAFSKCLTVTSNAKNKPQLNLCIKGTVKVPLSVVPTYAQFRREKPGSYVVEMTLSTERPDLKIGEVYCTGVSTTSVQAQAAWQNALPMHCMYTVTKSDSVNAGGSWDYKLLVTITAEGIEGKAGELVIKTNHPDSREVKTPCAFEAGASQQK